MPLGKFPPQKLGKYFGNSFVGNSKMIRNPCSSVPSVAKEKSLSVTKQLPASLWS